MTSRIVKGSGNGENDRPDGKGPDGAASGGDRPDGIGPGEAHPSGGRAPGTRRLDIAPGRVIKSEVASAQEIAREIRESVRAEAESILADARAEAEDLRSRAREEGYAEGLSEWTERVLEATRQEKGRLERSRDDLARLALRVARKILGRELAADDSTISDLVLQAVRGLHHEGRIRVYLRPDDMTRIQAERGRIVDDIGSNAEIEFVQDAQIESGGCRVETAYGIVDATLETQLRVLEAALLGKKR